jgi:AraC-like DNA-binding protein
MASLNRHLLRARDLMDARYADPLGVLTLARAAHVSPAHFSRQFQAAFGETPHQYLLTRRLERAASLLRGTDYSVARICMDVGLASVGSFTSSFKRVYGSTPTAYRDGFPPAAQMAHIPTCILMAASRPAGGRMRAPVPLPAIESSFEEDGASVAT